MSERDGTLTREEAEARLVDGDTVHCFRNPGGMLLGADWSRASVLKYLAEAVEFCETGPLATATGHGIAARTEGDSWAYFATKKSESRT